MTPSCRSRPDFRCRAGRRAVWLGAAVLAAAGCGDLFPPTHPYSTLEVEVVSEEGEPIPEVGLVLYDWKREMAYGQTRSDGTHVFRYIPEGGYGVMLGVPPGYDLPEGAERHVDGIWLANSARERVGFVLRARRGSVRVVVLDSGGAPFSGVDLVMYSSSGLTRQGVTGEDGSHTFTVTVGEYGVRPAVPSGYRSDPSHVDGIVVEEGVEREVTFSLSRTG